MRRSAPSGEVLIKSLYDRVASDLGARILGGEFLPGDLLPNEAACGKSYGVSRTAVREAVKMLTAKGLVRSRPKIGSRVQPRTSWNLLDRDVLGWYCAAVNFARFADEVQQLRFMIEPAAAALAAARRNSLELSEIEQAFAEMAASRERESWNRADVKFHLAILNASGNELIIPFGRVIETLLANLFVYTFASAKDPRQSLPLHEGILRNIRDQKVTGARRAVLRLLEDTSATLERARRRRGTEGKGLQIRKWKRSNGR